jgi:protein-L-isoaspartate(D-aspartate) O-methyltransferase
MMIYSGSSSSIPPGDIFEKHRKDLVQSYLIPQGIKDQAVLNAFLNIPRHLFVPPALQNRAYDDDALPIGSGQTISKPSIIAKILQYAHPAQNKTVLEIGTGSGYQAALLSVLTRHVYSIERIDSLAREASKRLKNLGFANVSVKTFDGTYGWESRAPFDTIIVAAAAPAILEKLVDQLSQNGIMICPVGSENHQRLHIVQNSSTGLTIRELERCHFVPLIGKYGWK